jgi:hypothetical protein
LVLVRMEAMEHNGEQVRSRTYVKRCKCIGLPKNQQTPGSPTNTAILLDPGEVGSVLVFIRTANGKPIVNTYGEGGG